MERRLSRTSCACWCDGCTFSPCYEMLCICFKAAGSNLSPAAGQGTAISLMWCAPSRAAVIIITVGKRKSAICLIYWLCKEVHSFQRGKEKKKRNSTALDYITKRRVFWWISGNPAVLCFLVDFILLILRYLPVFVQLSMKYFFILNWEFSFFLYFNKIVNKPSTDMSRLLLIKHWPVP